MKMSQERADKFKKMIDFKTMLNTQMIEQKVQKRQLVEEKIKAHKDISIAVIDDQRVKDRIIFQTKKRIVNEKASRDQQISLKQKQKVMETQEQRMGEKLLIDKLHKELEEEKQKKLNKRKRELLEARKVIQDNELAKIERIKVSDIINIYNTSFSTLYFSSLF
jgi:hypothetical protein